MPTTNSTTNAAAQKTNVFGGASAVPGLLVAHAPLGSTAVDRCLVSALFGIGRATEGDLTIADDKVSKRHLRIFRTQEGFFIEDLGSTNGTFLNGVPLHGTASLASSSVLRVGRAVLVFHADAGPLLESPPAERHGLSGRFHAAPFLRLLQEASLSSRHVLLTGPSGSGKELSAHALCRLLGKRTPLPLVVHNAARFSTEEEAASTLFGVAPRVFSGVDARPGLIEQASGGVLFLDEIHNLPGRVQRSLLRVVEDSQCARIGEANPRTVDVRFVLASNLPGPEHGVAPDLLARLRVVRLPSLAARVADIPSIFLSVLEHACAKEGVDFQSLAAQLGGDHFEAMCLDGFPKDNVRGLVDVVDRLLSRVRSGTDPAVSVATVFTERFAHGPVATRFAPVAPTTSGLLVPTDDADSASHYEVHRAAITAAYRECDGNLSATERLLKSRGIRCSRRWLTVFVDKWSLR